MCPGFNAPPKKKWENLARTWLFEFWLWEIKPHPNSNLGRSWYLEYFEIWLWENTYVETNICIPQGYHLVCMDEFDVLLCIFTANKFNEQECIPVGCILQAAVAVSWGGVCLSACWDTPPGPGPPRPGPDPPGVGLDTPQVWAWTSPRCGLDTPS